MARAIADIDADIAAVNAAIQKTVTGGEEYSADTGATRVRRKNVPLQELRRHLHELQAERLRASDPEVHTSHGV